MGLNIAENMVISLIDLFERYHRLGFYLQLFYRRPPLPQRDAIVPGNRFKRIRYTLQKAKADHPAQHRRNKDQAETADLPVWSAAGEVIQQVWPPASQWQTRSYPYASQTRSGIRRWSRCQIRSQRYHHQKNFELNSEEVYYSQT